MTLTIRKKTILGLALAASLTALVGCSTVDKMTGSMSSAMRGDEKLAGSAEVPPVVTAATGKANITVSADGAVSGAVSTSGIAGTAAHIHMAPVGQNGPVIVPLTKTGDSSYSVPAGAKLTPDQLTAYKKGGLYVNVHSSAHKDGEIRAQLKP